jgi:hypothetical protein
MSKIHSTLKPGNEGQEGLRSIAIYGVGGLGKSQTALTYAHRHVTNYDAIFWGACPDSPQHGEEHIRCPRLAWNQQKREMKFRIEWYF